MVAVQLLLLGRIIIIFFFLLLIPICPLVLSVSETEALLNLKKSFTNAKELQDSWTPDSNPCNDKHPWVGVICYNGVVISLRLGQLSLSGVIDIDALTEMPGLRSISFTNNAFSGPLPRFNRLGALKTLFLTGNKFSGEIADDYFANMASLKKIWLSSNQFTGPIPSSLTNLKQLVELHLENNQFSGKIPPWTQSSLVSLNLSNNNLQGEIPAGLSKFNESSFAGNPGLCGAQMANKCSDASVTTQPPPTSSGKTDTAVSSDKQDSVKLTAAVLVLVMVFLMLLAATIVVVKRRREDFDVLGRENLDEPLELHVSPTRRTTSQKDPDSSSRRGTGSRRGSQKSGAGDLVVVNDEKGIFGLPDLMKAAAEVLGNGSLGSAYKAVMTNGVAVVVKRMREMNKVGRDGFDMEMRRLGELHHRNILTPLAYHYRKEEKLVVYEYIPKGSLLYLLHGDRGSCQAEFDWPARLRIVQGIARGMGFLHSELGSYDLPHGNLKSSNIFLSSNYEPLIADYGFWSLVNPTQAAQAMFAYKSPEFIQYHHASPKSDVYCFGIVILEILTGKFPSQYLNSGTGGTDVVQWVLSAISEGRQSELFDPELTRSQESFSDMERLLQIGAACVEQSLEQRPSMREVVRRIDEIRIEGGGTQFTSTLKEEYAKLSASSSPMH